MGDLTGPDFPAGLCLAVSGGGDSMAMLHLAAGWARPMGIGLRVATVDHGLRPEAAAEAALVADEARGLGLPHETLHWNWDGQGNLQDAARRGRHALLGAWAGGAGVLYAHTQDDQAETLLLRLARGSGVDGLSGMAPRTHLAGLTVLRPLLDATRAELRHYLATLRIPFVDDPSNDDPAYDRVRARAALEALAPLGLSRARLAATAGRMARARRALEARAHEAARALLRPARPGLLRLDRDGLAALDPETRLRLLAGALRHVASAPYRPREEALASAVDRALSGGTATLHGAMLVPREADLWIGREARAVADLSVPAEAGARWDGRWALAAPHPGAAIAAWGADAAPDEAPRRLCAALPCLRVDGQVVHPPPGADGPVWIAERSPHGDFPAILTGN
ncbi:tRNA lysidine(34) synthetase TilS [Wenxinia saemankumensis]|uniref:tRNA(Ile)-lysidine synthase n=1 Tax=Wenxinia saemankumensis TaxID=1447782 RepID=A0A1M6BZM3_9RHOB|nr:tRNA lysidine(34) synthetase TilS [Wenxinia saemankumensis]SHI54226.1 tRNA(Ile)-lysidine synthase [Wenxinia saemankumensis]